jgi:16S rRNA (guanine966-N2)-methyltransferase
MTMRGREQSPPGQVRIISGAWRGQLLPVPDAPGLRPTPDRVRETVFNWLQPRIEGARCLDLFAGTGALGFESASRGAGRVVLVESSPGVADGLSASGARLGAEQVQVVNQDVMRFLGESEAEPFDIVFADPPFDSELLPELCQLLSTGGWLTSDAWVYLEVPRDVGVPSVPGSWVLLRSKTAGEVGYHMFVTP